MLVSSVQEIFKARWDLSNAKLIYDIDALSSELDIYTKGIRDNAVLHPECGMLYSLRTLYQSRENLDLRFFSFYLIKSERRVKPHHHSSVPQHKGITSDLTNIAIEYCKIEISNRIDRMFVLFRQTRGSNKAEIKSCLTNLAFKICAFQDEFVMCN